MRSTIAHIRQSRIAPSAITAPAPNFIPQPTGVGTPALDGTKIDASTNNNNAEANAGASEKVNGSTTASREDSAKRGLQEERVHRDASRGILDALTRLKEARERERIADTSAATLTTE